MEGDMFLTLCAGLLIFGIAIKLVGPKESLSERRRRFTRTLKKGKS